MSSAKKDMFLSAWKKYIPVIRILLKKSAAEVQILNINRSDFERDAKRKSGYKFVVNFINSRPDEISAGNELIQSFTSSLQEDEVIYRHLSQNNYTFTLNTRYQLQIKNNSLPRQGNTPALTEEMEISAEVMNS